MQDNKIQTGLRIPEARYNELKAMAEAVRDQTQAAVDELTSAYRLIAG